MPTSYPQPWPVPMAPPKFTPRGTDSCFPFPIVPQSTINSRVLPMQVRIKGYSFSIAEPYSEGHTLTRGEAQALNGVRAENVRNNLKKLVDEAQTLAGDRLLSPGELAQIQSRFTEYDAGYSFEERRAQAPRRGDLEIAAREIATEVVDARARQEGLDLTPEDREVFIEQVAQDPGVLEQAHQRATAKRQALADSLADLIGGE